LARGPGTALALQPEKRGYMKFKGILLWSFLSLKLVAIAQTGGLGNLLELRRLEGITEPPGALGGPGR